MGQEEIVFCKGGGCTAKLGPGALAKVLEKLPSVGTIVSGDDSEGVERLLRKLSSIIDERTDRFTAASAATLSDYQRISGHTNDHRICCCLMV